MDHLTALPSELQHMVFSYLLPTHEPDKAFETETANEVKSTTPASHPLDYLAATCRSLRAEIMDFSQRWLNEHRDITKPPKNTKPETKRNPLRGKKGLMTFIEKHCVFCGKTSKRSAILMNGFRCCYACDRDHWPNKITKTNAKEQFDLKDHHLLPHSNLSRNAAKLLAKYPGGFPKLRYGTYITHNVPTTMFLKDEVEKLAKLAHGDLVNHLAERQAAREERSRKLKATQAEIDAKAYTRRLEMEREAAEQKHVEDERTRDDAEALEKQLRAVADPRELEEALNNPNLVSNAGEMEMLATEMKYVMEHAGLLPQGEDDLFGMGNMGSSGMFVEPVDGDYNFAARCFGFA